jgi:hypothetical protein
MVPFLAEAKDFSVHQIHQTGSEGNPTSYSMSSGDFPQG